MRLLPIRAGNVGNWPPVREPQADRRRHRRSHERQSLPLRDLPTHSRRREGSGQDLGSLTMFAGSLQKLTPAVDAPSRRHFLLGAAAVGGGLAVGFRAAAAEGPVQAQAPFAHTQVNPFSAYLTITPESLVVVHSAHMDMGQGPYHGLATLVAEELGADWSQMRADGAWGSTQFYGNLVWGGAMQGTGGSPPLRPP